MRSTLFPRLLFVVITLLCLTSLVFAGTTGKIAGVVKDADTGEPLPGVNVVIQGSNMGAATDLNGEYSIINLRPGEYTVSASMMGYALIRVTDVRVSIDLTTTQNFKLNPSVIEGEEVTVVAERPIVQMDMTSSLATVGAQEMDVLPAESVSEVLSLQAGIVNAGGLHIRGGRSNEVVYMVDGVATTNAYNGGNTANIENAAIQELQVISGTFNAEYGRAMSGIINIITKDGGEKYHGELTGYVGDYMSNDDLYSVMDYVEDIEDPETGSITQIPHESNPLNEFNPIYNLQGSLSGPVPFTNDKLTFFVNARRYQSDGYLYGREWFLPQGIPGDSSLVNMNPYERTSALGKLAWKLTDGMKLTYSMNFADSYNARSYSQVYKYVPGGRNQSFGNTQTHTLTFNHVLSNKTFYEIKINKMSTESEWYLYDDVDARPNWFVSYQMPTDTTGENFETVIFDPNEDTTLLDSVKYYEYDYDWVVDPDNPEGYVHPDSSREPTGYSYRSAGTDLSRGWSRSQYWTTKFDITSQVNSKHQLKAGFEYTLHELDRDTYTLIPAIDPVDSIQVVPFAPAIPSTTTPGHDQYNRKPREFSGYIQDKIELKDLIMNIGLRFDWFDANYVVPTDPTDINIYNPFKYEHIYNGFDEAYAATLAPLALEDYLAGLTEYTPDERRDFMHTKVKPKMQVSPRLGIAYPITDKGVIHFSYGHFFQMPTFQYLYAKPDFKIDGGGDRTIIGNADLDAQKTVQYELGLQQQIGQDIGIDVTIFYRDIRDWVATEAPIETYRTGVLYTPYVNKDYSNVRGITFKMDKRFSRSFAFQLDYSLMWAEGTYSNPNDAFNAANNEQAPQKILVPMNWDRRHSLNAQLIYRLNGWTASMIGRYYTGLPYTPSFARGEFVGGTNLTGLPTNSESRPHQYWVDFKLEKNWTMKNGLRVGVFTYIDNLLDTRAITGVFSDTGSPTYTTNPILDNVGYDARRVSTTEDYFSRPTWYIAPRQVRLGLRIGF